MDYPLFLPKRMQRTALVGKTNEMYNLLLGELAQVHPITRALSGTPLRLEARIFARPLAKAKQVAERDINNTNVREAIVRPKGDKNINQQLIARKPTHCALRGIEG